MNDGCYLMLIYFLNRDKKKHTKTKKHKQPFWYRFFGIKKHFVYFDNDDETFLIPRDSEYI